MDLDLEFGEFGSVAAHASHEGVLLRVGASLVAEGLHRRHRRLLEDGDVHVGVRAELLAELGVVRDDVVHQHHQLREGLVLIQPIAVHQATVGELRSGRAAKVAEEIRELATRLTGGDAVRGAVARLALVREVHVTLVPTRHGAASERFKRKGCLDGRDVGRDARRMPERP